MKSRTSRQRPAKKLPEKMERFIPAPQLYEAACFPGGTVVHTKEGLKPIDQIVAGDWVLSKHERNEGERDYKRVTNVCVHEDREVILLYIGGRQADGSNRYRQLVVTPEHPFWVRGKGWKGAGALKRSFPKRVLLELVTGENSELVGNVRLFRTDISGIAWVPISSAPDNLSNVGSHLDVATMTTIATGVNVDFESLLKTHRVKPEYLFRTTVYNVEVEDFHTYFVGEAGVWVHNKNRSTKLGTHHSRKKRSNEPVNTDAQGRPVAARPSPLGRGLHTR
jgi:hypothetical protein